MMFFEIPAVPVYGIRRRRRFEKTRNQVDEHVKGDKFATVVGCLQGGDGQFREYLPPA